MKEILFLLKYISYYLRAKSRYKIHSPFIYDLLINVIYYKNYEAEFEEIEKIRESLREDNRILDCIDEGANGINGKHIRKKVKSIASGSAVKEKYCRLLYRIVKYYEPETLIELGTSLGISTMYQSLGAEKGRIITIEANESASMIAAENFRKLNLKNIEQITENFDIALPKILSRIERLDYVFYDGNHRKEPTIKYFEECLTKSHNDTVFVFDDIHWSVDMEEAWTYIQKHPRVTLTLDLFFMGLVFFTKTAVKQHHAIRF